MPGSQLKQLKASLNEKGLISKSQPKKQNRKTTNADKVGKDRASRLAALAEVRERYNPFEARIAKPSKYDSLQTNGRNGTKTVHRPGVTKGKGEETRRQTLLVEVQRRQKVGGVLDRRFGEDNPSMTPEERAMERFVREKQRTRKASALFDLENDSSDEEKLTHGGRSLFETTRRLPPLSDESGASSASEDDEGRAFKRQRLSDEMTPGAVTASAREDPGQSEQPKTRQEVMKEVIAKSKLQRYERQKAKEDDEELRAELDADINSIYALLGNSTARGSSAPEPLPAQTAPDQHMNPDRAALLNGSNVTAANKDYDAQVRQMTYEARSKPSTRTLTEEEKAKADVQRLNNLEEQRLRRMRGEVTEAETPQPADDGDNDPHEQEEDAIRLGSGITGPQRRPLLDVEDEDEFVLDDDLVTSASEVSDSASEAESAVSSIGDLDAEEREFVHGVDSSDTPAASSEVKDVLSGSGGSVSYLCPQSHSELCDVINAHSTLELSTLIQRIRAVNHASLDSGNKAKLAQFTKVLVQHLSFLPTQSSELAPTTLQALIRHIHSLAKTYPQDAAEGFREQLRTILTERSTALTVSDLMMFTAIGSIFPTSDQQHPVVTPAMLVIALYLSQKRPTTLQDLATGTYLNTLLLQFEARSKRYLPETVNYVVNAIASLAPLPPSKAFGDCMIHEAPDKLRVLGLDPLQQSVRRLRLVDIISAEPPGDALELERLKLALLQANVLQIQSLMTLWADTAAFIEIMEPFLQVISHLKQKTCCRRLPTPLVQLIKTLHSSLHNALQEARRTRLPLAEHQHRPIGIRTAIPKFEENFHPDKHYDPDRERTERQRLVVAHRRARKAALRELRHDARFLAREQRTAAIERDRAYDAKFKRLVAEIQGEEGRERNAYEREKRARKRQL